MRVEVIMRAGTVKSSVVKMNPNEKVYTFEACRKFLEDQVGLFKITLLKDGTVLKVINYDRLGGPLVLDKKTYGDFNKILVSPVFADEMKEEGFNDENIFVCTACNQDCLGVYYFEYFENGERDEYGEPFDLYDLEEIYVSKRAVKVEIIINDEVGQVNYRGTHTCDEDSCDSDDDTPTKRVKLEVGGGLEKVGSEQ